MQVREVMTSHPQVCTQSTKIETVAQMMVRCDCGAVPVVESEDSRKPIGIVTDRDIVTRVIAQGENCLQATVRAAMTETAVTVRENADVGDAMVKMKENHIRRILVVDENDQCTGIISEADLVRNLSGDDLDSVLKTIYEPMQEASSAY